MKKVILIAGILTAGITSANTISINSEKSTTSINEEEANSLEIEKVSKLSVECINIYHTTSCGVAAVTCQSGWSGPRMMEWAYALEENYCQD